MLSYEIVDPMQIFPIALRKHECEHEVPPNGPIEQLGHDGPDLLSTTKGGPRNRNRAEPQEQGTVAAQAPGRPELATAGDHIGNDVHSVVQSEGSGSQCRFPSITLSRINFF